MSRLDTQNGKVKSVFVGYESHGIFTVVVELDFGGACQTFGSLALKDQHHTRFIKELLRVFGVDELDKVKGFARIRRGDGDSYRITSIGHIIEDRWLDIEEFLAVVKAEGGGK